MEALRQLLAQHGLSLVFANVLVAQLGLPIPALPMLILAGALVAEGTLHLLPLTAAVVIASLLGDLPWYFAGSITATACCARCAASPWSPTPA